MTKQREVWMKRDLLILFTAVFAAMLVFYESAHPLMILDKDDWVYIYASRVAIPSLAFWNPSRLLPETLMPFTADLSVRLLYPVTGDYIGAITIGFGIVMSICVAIYCCEFYLLLTRKAHGEKKACFLLTVLFLILHFYIFRLSLDGNYYLFWAHDVTCVFFYVIPAIVNCSLVMCFLRTGEDESFLSGDHLLRKGVIAAAVYMAIFSNLFESIILAAYCGLRILRELFRFRKNRNIKESLKKQLFHMIVLVLWLISVYFEGNGGRGTAAIGLGFREAIVKCLQYFPQVLQGMNRHFVLAFAASILAFAIILVRERKKQSPETIITGWLLGNALVVAVFEVLLCAKVGTSYILRTSVLYGAYFSMICAVVLVMSYSVRKYARTTIILPLCLVILFSNTDTAFRTYAETNDLNAPAAVCKALNNSMIEQVLAAEAEGENTVTVHVFQANNAENWPHSYAIGGALSPSLYKHGITRNLMHIDIMPDYEINRRFHVNENAPADS